MSFTPQCIKKFINDAKKYKVLTPQEENNATQEQLIKHNMLFVVKIAKEFTNSNCELNDLVSEGMIGLILASKTHDKTYDGSMRLLEESLKSLNTDHLDTWQLHNIQTQAQVDEIFSANGAIKALEKAKSEGMVRFLGITGHFEPLVLLNAIRRYKFDSILMALNAADIHYLSFKNYLLPMALEQGIAIIGMKVTTRGRMLSTWTPPPLEEQKDARNRTGRPGTITIKEALEYNMTLPVSTTIIGVDNVKQVEENVKIASQFSPLCESAMKEIELKTLPIVRQGLYFRRWDLGA